MDYSRKIARVEAGWRIQMAQVKMSAAQVMFQENRERTGENLYNFVATKIV